MNAGWVNDLLKGVEADSCLRCGRTVSSPVRLTDLSRKPQKETYFACPFCFSRIDVEDKDEHEHLHGKGGLVAASGVEVFSSKGDKSAGKKDEAAGSASVSCPHGFGYLNSRPKESGIPDECLTCARILQCMTKAI